MLPLLSLHALAAQRGDGLRPELKALLERHAGLATGLAATIEPIEPESFSQVKDAVADVRVSDSEADGSTTSAAA
ncbi:hypothetical protein [Paraburkholderia sp. HP33-1]|uniref:hypothetical protein n=1 Tax=Paraburkholderia sp. HP33-1 TaxID=2883243 RepID=UPI001F3CC60C|nr:hypothetical protein [Paraburkholderia sp. HP33-1]